MLKNLYPNLMLLFHAHWIMGFWSMNVAVYIRRIMWRSCENIHAPLRSIKKTECMYFGWCYMSVQLVRSGKHQENWKVIISRQILFLFTLRNREQH